MRSASPLDGPGKLRGYKLSDDCRDALERATDEARRLGTPFVGTEHIVLSLLARPELQAARMLTALGLKPTYVRSQLEASLARDRSTKAPGRNLPYTSLALSALEAAAREAAAAGTSVVSSLHLLLGAMAASRSRASQILRRLGASQADVRSVLRRAELAPADFEVRIDDKSDRLIHEQVADQIREGVATGRLRVGDRLPAVRRLADHLGIAPGTVARAYGELETSGVVVTDGARGTYVAMPRRRSGPNRQPLVVRDLLRPAVVEAYHLGLSDDQLRDALEQAMMDIFPDSP